MLVIELQYNLSECRSCSSFELCPFLYSVCERIDRRVKMQLLKMCRYISTCYLFPRACSLCRGPQKRALSRTRATLDACALRKHRFATWIQTAIVALFVLQASSLCVLYKRSTTAFRISTFHIQNTPIH